MRKRSLVLSLALLAIVVLTPAGVSQYQYHWMTVPWRTSGPWQWANLSWSGTSGSIVWDGAASAEDNAPTDPMTEQEYTASNALRTYTGVDLSEGPRRFEFVSAPLDHDLVLNVTRPIQVEFFLKYEGTTKPCQYYPTEPKAEVRLKMGDKILAGANGAPYLYYYTYWYYVTPGSSSPPADPPGYTTCRFALGAEAAVIPAGTSLKLEVTWHQQARPYSIGFAGDHRSNIKFPLLPPEEILFRYPELAPSEDETPESESTSTGTSFAVAHQPPSGTLLPGLVAIAGLSLAAGRRRSLAPLLALLLTTVVLGGCITGGPKDAAATTEQLTGGVQNTFVKGGGLTEGDFGSIVGQVHDDLHVPISGAHVSILGAAEFTQTDSKGRFQFLNLVPGMFKVRFDKTGYRSFEAEIEVKSGFVSRPSIMLYLLDPKDRDARPHSHDYWAGQGATKELLNSRLPVTCDANGCALNYDFRIPQKGDEINSVLPGASEVEVTLDWDAAILGTQELGLAVQHNGDRFLWLSNHTIYAPRAKGVPFRIATSWEMTDAGHQPVSTWTFRWYEAFPNYYGNHVCTPGVAYACVPKSSLPGAPQPWIHAKIVVKRGTTLPLEPGHPDHWAAGSELPVMKGQMIYPTIYSTLPPSLSQCHTSYDCARIYIYPVTPTKIVPDGTQWVEVTIKQSRAMVFPYKPILYYKPANLPHNGNAYSVEGWKSVEPQAGGSWEKWSYKIPLKQAEADFVYAKASRWQFSVRADDMDAFWQDSTVGDGTFCNVVCTSGLTSVAGQQRMTFTFEGKAFNPDA